MGYLFGQQKRYRQKKSEQPSALSLNDKYCLMIISSYLPFPLSLFIEYDN